MDRTVADHIHTLEAKRTALSSLIMEERDREKRNQFEAELRAVESALVLFRSALEVESRIGSR